MELGILTPEQGIQTIKTGIYPEQREVGSGQEGYLEDRQKGLYSPLVGGQPLPLTEEEKEEQIKMEQIKTNHKKSLQKSGPQDQATPQQEGRPSGTNKNGKTAFADRKSIQQTIYSTESLFSFAQGQMKKAHNMKRLSKHKKSLLDELCKSVILSSEKDQWENSVQDCIKNFEKIESLSTLPQILETARENDMELYPSALYYHSKKHEDDSQK